MIRRPKSDAFLKLHCTDCLADCMQKYRENLTNRRVAYMEYSGQLPLFSPVDMHTHMVDMHTRVQTRMIDMHTRMWIILAVK